MSDFNIVVAHFGHHNRVVMTDTLYQYDYGQKLKVEGITALPQTFQAHFSNVQRGGVSITVTGINGVVDVPNSLLMTGKRIYCWIYVTETGSGETVYQILMPVQSRPMPEYYDVEDVGVFDSVVNQVAEYAATATTGATSATASATAAAGSATAAAASASAAADSAENAAASEDNAEASASAAQASDASAATAATTATNKAAEAAQSATSAGSAADRAEAAQEAAETAQEAAETAATSATADATTAIAKATAAAASATTASTKATDATNAATTATAQAVAAESAKTTAVEAKTAAQSAQSAAETAATNATAKATEAAASATAAAQAAASINTPDSALSDTSTNAVQNKVVTAKFTDVLSAISYNYIGTLKRYNGLIGTSGTWRNVGNASYKYVIVPVSSGDSVRIKANASTAAILAFVTAYSTPANLDPIPFSSASGFTARIAITKNTEKSYTVPSDVTYIILMTLNGTEGNCNPAILEINGIDFEQPLYNAVAKNGNDIAENKYLLFDPIIFAQEWETGTFTTNVGSPSINSAQTMRQRTASAVKNPIDMMLHSDGTFTTRLVLYTDALNVASVSDYTVADKIIPKDIFFRILIADAISNTTDISGYTREQVNQHISVSNNAYYDLINPAVNWCAMGDSITEGFVSYRDATTGQRTFKVSRDDSWVYKMARIKKWSYTNLGIGGTGWNKASNADIQANTDTTSAHYIARHTDFTPYNLVTLAYGINDWKGNYPTGSLTDDYDTPTTTIGGMRATIDAILASNPYIKIIVILPLNTLGYYASDQSALDDPTPSYGTYATDWGLGYSFSNSGTLEQFVQALISVCDYYGIQYIDQAHYSVLNRNNIKTLLTDGVHPNAGAHTALAKELSAKITFN